LGVGRERRVARNERTPRHQLTFEPARAIRRRTHRERLESGFDGFHDFVERAHDAVAVLPPFK
jgi:hypothetical protein